MLHCREFWAVGRQPLFPSQLVCQMPGREFRALARVIVLGKILRLWFTFGSVGFKQVEVLQVTLQVCALLICIDEQRLVSRRILAKTRTERRIWLSLTRAILVSIEGLLRLVSVVVSIAGSVVGAFASARRPRHLVFFLQPPACVCEPSRDLSEKRLRGQDGQDGALNPGFQQISTQRSEDMIG